MNENDPIRKIVREAISADYAISAERIVQLREKSEKEISRLKLVFWVAIGLLNVMIWDPFTTEIPVPLRIVVGLGSILVAFIFPLLGLRRHRRSLYQLEDSSMGPKRRNTDDAGRQYIDRVKKQGRMFVRAEYEVLEGQPLPE